MNIDTFEQRLSIGNQGAGELRTILESEGFIVSTTGQEAWLTPQMRERLRHDYTDLTVRAVRHKPDLLAYRPDDFPLTYFEAKVNTTAGTPNFSIEKACFDELVSLAQKGERCVVAFREVNRTWHANYVEKLVVTRDMSNQRRQARGSMTPYLLIAKQSTEPLRSFLQS